jgi:histidine ammonia-lyase
VVEQLLGADQAFYGINTGFGALAKKRISAGELATLQRNLVRSHSAGIGEPLREELVRAVMLLLAASLARGMSGVRAEVVDAIRVLLNSGLTPVVPSIGSVGASGDLAPLAHLASVLIGDGEVLMAGRRVKAGRALPTVGLRPLTLSVKEGLALINGTHLMAGEACLLACDLPRLIASAKVALAMSIDACRASHGFLDPRLYRARCRPRLETTARQVASLLRGSTIRESHRVDDTRVQDPYSLRAGVTVLGAAEETIEQCLGLLVRELGAVTDNPLVFAQSSPNGSARGTIVSGANFHGMPLAIPLDCLVIPIAHVAGISERRSYLMTGAFEPESRLRPFLATNPGVQSGLMIAQYTAAACVNEIIGLATPASVSNVPTCAGMEDYNSFGPRAAAKCRRALELAEHVVAIELIIAAQGLQSHRPLRSGPGVERAVRQLRRRVAPLTDDRPLTQDIEAVVAMIRAGVFSP